MPERDPDTLEDDAAYYRLDARSPSLSAAEIDSATTRAVEVQVLWGEYDAIHLSMLAPPRSFVVGEVDADFAMEASQIGAPRYPVTVVEDGVTYVIVPEGAEIVVRNRGVERKLHALHQEGALAVSGELPGALRYRLADDDVVRVRRAGFVFQVKSVAAATKLAAARRIDPRPAFYVGGAATFIGALMLALSLANPGGGALSSDGIDTSNRLVQSIISPTEHAADVRSTGDAPSADAGRRASGEEGASGRPDRPRTQGRRADRGDAPSATPQPDAVGQNRVLSTIATLAGSLGPSSSPFSAASAVGADPMSLAGALTGITIGENAGIGGLGLRGSGLGGGDPNSDLLRAGGIATNGDGPGRGPGNGRFGFGRCEGAHCGGDLGEREGVVPRVVPDSRVSTIGSLPADVIRRVVQRNVGQVRFCYEQALNGRPDLAGRVAVRFIIAPSGAVQAAVVESSTLGDARVESCIAGAMRRLSFPAPEDGGMVRVTYPFMLSSAGR